MKKIFLKEYNALFDYPIVKEPIASDFSFFGPYDQYEFDGASYQDALEQRETWLQSKIEIVGEHNFEDGKIYEEDVDFFLKEIGGLFDDGEGFETEVAIPID